MNTDRIENYEAAVEYLFAQLPMFQRTGQAAYKADLSTTRRLAAICGNPELGLKCVHVAGTNGKGSTCHALASVLQACGYRTGLMTSPHYKDFRERIKVDGQEIAPDFVVRFINRHRARFESLNPSFFELTVIMGFEYFQAMDVDIAVIETGMGGRLDSTNIVSPELSVITPIGLDHQMFLGDTLEEIAREKAGIIKIDTPVLVSEGNDEVMDVFEQVAQRQGAELSRALPFNSDIESDLRGPYQASNLNTAWHAISILQENGWPMDAEDIRSGFKQVIASTGFMGRWQILGEKPLMIADAAHNEHGIRWLVQGISQESYVRLHVVLAMAGDKDIDAVLSLLPETATYHVSQAKILRALPKEELLERLHEKNLKGQLYDSVPEALRGAKEEASPEDMVLITGSIFTVAEIL